MRLDFLVRQNFKKIFLKKNRKIYGFYFVIDMVFLRLQTCENIAILTKKVSFKKGRTFNTDFFKLNFLVKISNVSHYNLKNFCFSGITLEKVFINVFFRPKNLVIDTKIFKNLTDADK